MLNGLVAIHCGSICIIDARNGRVGAANRRRGSVVIVYPVRWSIDPLTVYTFATASAGRKSLGRNQPTILKRPEPQRWRAPSKRSRAVRQPADHSQRCATACAYTTWLASQRRRGSAQENRYSGRGAICAKNGSRDRVRHRALRWRTVTRRGGVCIDFAT